MREAASEDADRPYAMVVSCVVRPGQLMAVLDRLEAAMPRIRAEEGCLAFRVYAEPGSDTLWVYERWVSKRYHDEVHEAFPEIQALLAGLQVHLDGPWSAHGLRQLIER